MAIVLQTSGGIRHAWRSPNHWLGGRVVAKKKAAKKKVAKKAAKKKTAKRSAKKKAKA